MSLFFAVFIVLIAFLSIFYFSLRNGLVKKFNRVEQAYANLSAALEQRTYTLKSIAQSNELFNKQDSFLREIEGLLSKTESNHRDKKKVISNGKELDKLTRSIKTYLNKNDDAKIEQKVIRLQASLNEVEEQLSASKRSYNAAVFDYNNAIESFPSNLIANSLAYDLAYTYQELKEEEIEKLELKDLEKQKQHEKLGRNDQERNS